MHVVIREKSFGIIVWEGDCHTVEMAITAYRDELGAATIGYDAANPNWLDQFEITTWQTPV